MGNIMGKHVAGGGRATAATPTTIEVAQQYRDLMRDQVGVRSREVQEAFNAYIDRGGAKLRNDYRKAVRRRDATIRRYEKAAQRSRELSTGEIMSLDDMIRLDLV